MLKKYLITACLLIPGFWACSQDPKKDSIPSAMEASLAMDTSINYDELFDEFDLFLDSLLAPRNYFLVSLSLAQEYFNFVNKRTAGTILSRKYVWSPALGYYSKGGFGVTMSGYLVHDSVNLNLYQFSFNPSYDYLKDKKLATGISYLRYFTRDSLPFYASPLKNELYGYFLWRKSWLQPGITANYGWGNHTEYERIAKIYTKLVNAAAVNGTIRPTDTVTIVTANKESIVDFTLSASLRHDFYWLNLFSRKDYFRFTPQLSMSAGTQKFGFNRTSSVNGPRPVNVDYSNRSISLEQKFKVLSMTLYLRSDYSIGKFFLQPQLLLDYYFPGKEKNLAALFSINAGFMF